MRTVGWLKYLMGFAYQASIKSKDTTQVGAVLVGPDSRSVLATGYNGPPVGVNDDVPDRWERPRKYLFCTHAEQNIIAHAARHGIRTDKCKLYVTHYPCSACARSIIQAGIDVVVYGPGQTSMPEDEFDAARVMFGEAGVICIPLTDAENLT